MEMVSSSDFHTLFSHIFLCLLFFSLHVQPYTSPNKCMDLFFMFPIELLNACVNAIEVFPIPPNFIPDKAKLIPGQVGKYLVEHKERIEEEKTRKCERKGYGNQSSKPFPWKWFRALISIPFSLTFSCLLFFSLHVQPYTSPNKCMDLFFMFPIELLNACVNAIEVFPIPPNFIPDKAKLIPGQVGKYLVEHKERIEEEKTRKCERKGYGNQSSKPFPWKWWV
uniref:Uncharacterized protein n=1 Tax=Cucumis sativus TaxID=3659 RepID=A0A0A0KDF3_CUCSA